MGSLSQESRDFPEPRVPGAGGPKAREGPRGGNERIVSVEALRGASGVVPVLEELIELCSAYDGTHIIASLRVGTEDGEAGS